MYLYIAAPKKIFFFKKFVQLRYDQSSDNVLV